MDRRTFTTSIAAGALAAASSAAYAEDDKDSWGNLTATFLYDGEPPERKQLKIDKDEGFVKQPLFSQSLLIDTKSKGIANVLVWLDHPAGAKPLKLHSSYDAIAKEEVVIDGLNAQIEPHVTALWTRQTLILRNTDPIGLNLSLELHGNPELQPLIRPGGDERKALKNSEPWPVPIQCHIHSWMSGYLLVKDHPYFAISNKEGKLTIKNLPVGTHKFVVWHELQGIVSDVTRDGTAEKWKAGRVTIDIKPGDNDLGKIEFKPAPRKG